MKISVIIFGHLAEITGRNKLDIENINNTAELIQQLQKDYPLLMTARYVIAVDKKVIRENTFFNSGSVIALLPPFSGG